MKSYDADVVGQMLMIAFFFGFLVCMVVVAVTDWLGGIVGRYAARKMTEHETGVEQMNECAHCGHVHRINVPCDSDECQCTIGVRQLGKIPELAAPFGSGEVKSKVATVDGEVKP